MTFGKRLKISRNIKGLTQKELAGLIGAKHNSISNWENDQNKPDTDTIQALCKILDISPSYLISGNNGIGTPANIYSISTKKIPLLGEIACGKPMFCNRDFESYVEAGADIHADFAVKAHGDSMINARILDGDIVFIREQPIVENGEIAAVCIDNEATLKRVYISAKTVTLIAENPAFEPIIYQLEDAPNIRILGKAIAFQSNL